MDSKTLRIPTTAYAHQGRGPHCLAIPMSSTALRRIGGAIQDMRDMRYRKVKTFYHGMPGYTLNTPKSKPRHRSDLSWYVDEQFGIFIASTSPGDRVETIRFHMHDIVGPCLFSTQAEFPIGKSHRFASLYRVEDRQLTPAISGHLNATISPSVNPVTLSSYVATVGPAVSSR